MRVLSRTLTFVALSLSTAAYAGTPAFLILADGAPITQRAHDFEASGVVVRQRVPPRVMIVEVPSGMNPATLPGVMSAFTAAVPISSLESIGPSAVAAGVHWNRRVIIDGAAPAGGFAAARQMAADRSLPSPADFRLSPLDDRVAAEWSSVDGAPFYELEASIDPMFRSTYLRTMTGATRVEFAGPGDAGLVYVRVRAGDPRPDGILWGSWTNVVNQAAPSAPAAGAAPPTLTSPANGIESEGFEVLLEWTGADRARVQVARDAGFSDVVFDEIAAGGRYPCLSQAMNVKDHLYWRVQAWSPARSDWSAARDFTVGEPKAATSDAFVNPEAPK